MEKWTILGILALVSSNSVNEFGRCSEFHSDGDGGALHDALFFAFGYLSVKDLLSVGMVCKSLRDAVQNDPLLWRNMQINITGVLLQLSSSAQVTLQCLSLVDCLRITETGLSDVLESNLGLTKLSVPGCVRLSAEGILCNLKTFKSSGLLGIKHLSGCGSLE